MERIKKAMEKARARTDATTIPKAFSLRPQVPGATTSCLAHSDIKTIALDPESLARHRIIAGNAEDPRAAWFDMLRAQVVREMRDKGYRTVAVSSPTPECGKTTVAINLALSVAQQTEPRVFLGDFDFRRPKVAEYLGINPDRGLPDFFTEDVSLEEVLVDTGVPRLLVLPNTNGHRNAAEMLTSQRMNYLFDILRMDDENRVNICDVPPLLSTDEAIAFFPQADCVLLVVADRSTKKPELEEALRLLRGTALLGVVLNKSSESPRSYYELR